MIKKARIGIIGAMKIELEGFLEKMSGVETVTVGGIDFYYGTLCEKEAVLAVSGVGKVFASMCAQTMILEFSPDLIINTGVAGTLSDRISIGGMVIATEVVQHDMDTSAIGDPIGMISGINIVNIPCSKRIAEAVEKAVLELGVPYIFGRIASGDQFISETTQKNRIKSLFDASACEMEGAAIGQVCYVNKVEFGVIRAISDGGDENATFDFPKFARDAAARSVAVLCKAIPSL